MDLSLSGLLGAVLGTIVSAVVYGPLISVIEGGLQRSRDATEDPATFGQELPLLRRAVLATDMLLCAGLGYWIGQRFGG
jgi:hypothetical protein